MLILLGAAACAERHAGVVDCAHFGPSPSQFGAEFSGYAGTVMQQEYSFVCHATTFGRAQMDFARMAQQQAANPTVVRFAADTIDEQATINRHLFRIAIQQDGIAPPRELDAPHLAMRDQLARLSGDAFDRAYLHYVVQDGQAAIAVFNKETSAGAEPDLSRFAADALPRIEQRVLLAQSIIGQ
ncbi:MAG: DUF4142 domain-containing protein [Stellaceae bacterium]